MHSPPSTAIDPPADAEAERPPQLPFTFRITRLLHLLRRSGMLANRREFGLSEIEWRIMSQVGAHAPLSLNELAELVNLDRGQLSRAVKALVQRGLLNSRRRPGGPAIVITLSEEGVGLHQRMKVLAEERNAFLTGGIPEEEIERAAVVLASVSRKAQELLDREQAYVAAAQRSDGAA